MSGGSRGGLTSVNMASNPYSYDYTVLFAAATATPSLLGEHALLTSTTYPPLLPSTAWSVGLSDSWHTGWTYPPCAGRPHLTGLSGPLAHLSIMTASADPGEGDSQHSPLSPRFIQGLKDAGTQVFLTVTEKDNIVPYNTQIKYAFKLMQSGVPTEVEVLLRGGHTERFVNTIIGKAYARIDKLITHVMAYVEGKQQPQVSSGMDLYAANRNTGVMEPLSPADNNLPFSVDVPYITARGMRFPLVFVGTPGTEYNLNLENDGGHLVALFDGVIPAEPHLLHTGLRFLMICQPASTASHCGLKNLDRTG